MFTNRRPYHGLKMSTTDFFREPVRYLKESNTQESMMEKPYLEDEYPKMHLKLPDFKFKPREIPSIFGPIANGDPYPGFAMINFGDANCGWDITNVSECIEGPILITMWADFLWHAEFDFVAGITSNSADAWLTKLGATTATSRDRQNYLLTFPKNSDGSVSVCGFASTHTLVSQIFETVVAGMPVGIHLVGGALVPLERGQDKPATLLKSIYGDKGDSCGCINFTSSCGSEDDPSYGCSDIGYTENQMGTGESQDLSVLNPTDGINYSWSIVSGAGDLSTYSGLETQYTAPETNNYCVNNPTITLSIDGYVCSTLNIAINSASQSGWAYMDYSEPVVCTGGYCQKYVTAYRCTGAPGSSVFQSCIYNDWITCDDGNDCGGCSTGNVDIRTELQKEEGCCPAGLL